MDKKQFVKVVNEYTQKGTPYLFMVDFNLKTLQVFKKEELESEKVFFSFENQSFVLKNKKSNVDLTFKKDKLPFDDYKKAFKKVKTELQNGNTYLTNLTFKTKIEFTDERVNLLSIFLQSKSKYKLLYKDKFVCFSPEPFIKIKNNVISTFPMKGTIDASVKNANQKLLDDKKESREHNTIVDLLRNDLSIVATDVKVKKFKYLEKIITQKGKLLQMSSEISGKLPLNWKENFGNILLKLLPAGSVTGAPKQKTVKIIKESENSNRGFYTGVFGFFDGENVNSAVLIRFIEKEKDAFYYKSGGGITYLSDVQSEYNELLQKIYIPV
jgi:para-aminobenzoate synthetase component 1